MRFNLLLVISFTVLVASFTTAEPGEGEKNKADEEASQITKPKIPKGKDDVSSEIEAAGNGTAEPNQDASEKNVYTLFNENRGMLKRALYVTLAITGILVLYFGIRIIRSRKRRVKKYGLLSEEHESLGMQHLNSDSDEDMTVYDARTNHM